MHCKSAKELLVQLDNMLYLKSDAHIQFPSNSLSSPLLPQLSPSKFDPHHSSPSTNGEDETLKKENDRLKL